MVPLEQVLQVLRAISQATRLRILVLLAETELCSCELVELLGVSQPAISQHMRVLKRAGLVTERKLGTWVYYRLDNECLGQTLSWLAAGVSTPRTCDAVSADDWLKLAGLLDTRQQHCPGIDEHRQCHDSRKG